MNQKRIFILGILLAVGLLCGSTLFAETVSFGDYTTPGLLSGDLNVISGDITISSGTLIIEGSVKLSGGKILLSSGDLIVDGDLIISNTETTGDIDAYISVAGNIRVGGAIIITSENGTAYVDASSGSLKAGSISTNGYGASHVNANTFIEVTGSIYTLSKNSDAFVESSGGYLHAGSITTSGKEVSGVYSSSAITVLEEIRVRSLDNSASVTIAAGDLFARGITTDANLDSYVEITGVGNIDVAGGIHTYSETQNASIFATEGGVKADYIYLDAALEANLLSYAEAAVKGDIYVHSVTDTAVVMVSALSANNITTSAYRGAIVHIQYGDIEARGSIQTYSEADWAYVLSVAGSIKADEIFTDAYGMGNIGAANTLDVNGPIVAFSRNDAASIAVSSEDLYAQEVFTDGYGDAYISVAGNMEVRGDVATKSQTGDAYINVTGNLTARGVTTDGAIGADNSITVGGTSEVYHSEFVLDANQDWNSQLVVTGLYELIGNGNMLSFGDDARINVQSGGTLVMNNIILDNVGRDMIACEDDTATISFHNVTWSLTDNIAFGYGNLEVLDNLVVKGVDKVLTFSAAGRIFIANNAALVLDSQLTFSYASASADRFEMGGTQSKLVLNDTTFIAWTDCTLSQGLILTDGFVQLKDEGSATLDLSGINNIAIHGGIVRTPNVVLPPHA